MAKKNFEPIGEVARWRVLYGLLQQTKVDEILAYEKMGKALKLDPLGDRTLIQLAMRRAAKELEKIDKHAVRAVPNVGYRVLQAKEHLGEAERHQGKASRSLVRSRSKVTNVDFNELDEQTRNAFELVGQALSMQFEAMRRLDIRQKRTDQALKAVHSATEETKETVADLAERLAWLEKQQGKGKTSD